MPSVGYDVELIVQEKNPICWIASCAMVKGFGTKTSVGVGEFTGGFDPSTSCIANLAKKWSECIDLMKQWGFDAMAASDLSIEALTADDLYSALDGKGPAVLLHLCEGFPYGAQWPSFGKGSVAAHAVVLTGLDQDNNLATFNNPWGDKNQTIPLNVLLKKINADSGRMGKVLGFWRG